MDAVPSISSGMSSLMGNGVKPSELITGKGNYDNWNGDWLGYLEFMASHGDAASTDKLVNYLLTEKSAETARNWTAEREDTALQRFVKDAKAGGLNPYALLAQGGNPIASSSSGSSYSGTTYTSQRHAKIQESQAWLKTLISLIPMTVALVAAIV